jgi:hypothetical protein
MRTRTIYIRETDLGLWDEFEKAAAARRGQSVSSLLAEVIRYWLDQTREEQP